MFNDVSQKISVSHMVMAAFRSFFEITGKTLEFIYTRTTLHKFIKLKQRYILTKSGAVRVRYVMIAFAVLGCMQLLAATVYPKIFSFDFSPASEAPYEIVEAFTEGELEEALRADQARRTRHAQLASVQSYVAAGMRRASEAIVKPRKTSKTLTLGKGETIAGVLQDAGVSGTEAYQIVKTLTAHFDPRTAKPGQELQVVFKPNEESDTGEEVFEYQKMIMPISPVKEVSIIKEADSFVAKVTEKQLKPRTYARQAKIQNSLYGSAMKAGIPEAVIARVMRNYAWSIDFQRDIRGGDGIEVLYEAGETADGSYKKYGDILFANLNVRGRDIKIYRYEFDNGRVEYFNEDGISIKKTLMKTPVDGARISSGYGMRKHPILGYNKMHKGVDFAAPTGTPIYAAGDGVVSYRGRKGGYGNYIKLRHNGTISTAYAHLHKFAKGVGTGARVKQGDIIGYVGSTGRSTGPHLHYEVIVNGRQVNPNSVDLPTGEELKGKQLARFKDRVRDIDRKYRNHSEGFRVAQKEEKKRSKSFLR